MLSIYQIIITDVRLPRLEIKLLLQYILSKNAVQLITHDNYVLSNIEYNNFNQVVLRRQNGIPIAYIIGCKEFYSREFKVNEHTLVPRPETELLVDTVLKLAQNNDYVLDMGTGSGCIAITLKLECPSLCIDALDNYLNTLDIARQNALLLNADVEFIQSNWFSNITKKYNIIVSNPPYIAKNDQYLLALQAEPQHALSDFNDGLDCIRQIIGVGKEYLLPNGYMVFEHGYDQGNVVRELFKQNGFINIITKQDYAGLDRVTLSQFL